MSYNQKMRLPDGQELIAYNEGNTKSGSIRMDGSSLKINGAHSNVHISNGANLIFQGSTATLGGTNSIVSLGQSGDTVALDVAGVTYKVGTLTGTPTITGNTTINGNLDVNGDLTPTSMSGTIDMTGAALSFARNTDTAKIHYVDHGASDDSQLTIDVGDRQTDYLRIRGANSSGVMQNAMDIANGLTTVYGTLNATTLQEGGTSLSGLYLGLTATAADSAKLNGQAASYYATATHTHNKIDNQGRVTQVNYPATASRNSLGAGLYTYGLYNITGAPINYGNVLSFGGAATQGHSEILVSWHPTSAEMYFRGLRDTADDWYAWKKVWHDGNFTPGNKAETSTTITAGTGLTGGGSLASNRTISLDTTHTDTLYLGKTDKAANSDMLDSISSGSFLRSDEDDTYTGTLTVDGDIDINGLISLNDIPLSTHREGGKMNFLSRVSGRMVNKNPDFFLSKADTVNEVTPVGYKKYDDASSPRLKIHVMADDHAPNASGRVLYLDYDPIRPGVMTNPGYGGFKIELPLDELESTNWGYRAGNRYIYRIVAKFPSNRKIEFRGLDTGDQTSNNVNFKWLTSDVGTGMWTEYVGIQTIGEIKTATDPYDTTGYFAIMDINPAAPTDVKFSTSVAICQVIGIDEVPDVDRAPSLNVGYKNDTDIGWGEVYATGKITTDDAVYSEGLYLKGASGVQSESGNSFLILNNSANNAHLKINEGNKKFYLDAEEIIFRKTDATIDFTISSTGDGTFNNNLSVGDNLTVGGQLELKKVDNWSSIKFTAQVDDIGYIKHFEHSTDGTSEMRFSVSDNNVDTDFFSFGNTYNTWTEGAKITASGKGTFKGLTTTTLSTSSNVTVAGNLSVTTSTDELDALKIGSLTIGQKATNSGELIITNLSELRFGSTTSSTANWNQWGGIKYFSSTNRMVIGGPASSAFTSEEGTTPPRSAIDFQGIVSSSFDGKVIINDNANSTIGLQTVANGWLQIGSSDTSKLSLDPNEVISVGADLHVGTADGKKLYLTTAQKDRVVIDGTGQVGIGPSFSSTNTTPKEPQALLHISGGNGSAKVIIEADEDNVTETDNPIIEFVQDGGIVKAWVGFEEAIVSNGLVLKTGDGSGHIAFAPNNSEKVRFLADGNVAIGKTTAGAKLDVNGTILSNANITGLSMTASNGDITLSTAGKAVVFSGGKKLFSTSTDTKSIRSDGSFIVEKSTTAGERFIQAEDTLKVGQADELVVNATSLNYRNTLYVENTKLGINKASPEHPLDIMTSTTHSGINIRGTGTGADSLTYGISWRNTGGSYSWHLARAGTNSSPDLVLYGGNSAGLSTLTNEVVRFYNAGDTNFVGKMFVRGGSAWAGTPSIHLAVGDTDTGIKWNSDGNIDITANGTGVINVTNTAVGIKKNTSVTGTLDVSSTLAVGSDTTVTGHVSLVASSGRGLRFWNSDSYKIYMSATSDSTWGGGALTGAASSDYNFYYRITGVTRGHIFQQGATTLAQIDGNGKVHSKAGFQHGKFSMEYNSTEDSLDFVYG